MSKNKKVRVFISQLMKDKSDEEIQAERAAVKNAIQYGFREECGDIIDKLRLLKPVHPTDNDPTIELFEELLFRVKLGNLVFVKNYAEEYMICFSKPDHVNMEWLEFLDNFMPDLEVPEDVSKEIYYLSKSTEVLSHADLVIFTKGWKKGRGTVLEHDICEKYNIPHIELSY